MLARLLDDRAVPPGSAGTAARTRTGPARRRRRRGRSTAGRRPATCRARRRSREQTEHAVSVSTGTRTCAPCSESSNEIRTCASRSSPRSGCRLRRARRRRRTSRRRGRRGSPRSNSSKRMPPTAPPGNAPAGRLPNVSYALRFSGSERTSYAACTSLNRSSAPSSPGFRSGWYSRASLRYAFLISSSEAFFATPSDSYGLLHQRSFGDDHPRGTDDPVAHPVAALHDLEHGARLGAVARLREQRLVDVRVERRRRSRSRAGPPSRAPSRSACSTSFTPSTSCASSCCSAASSARSRSSRIGQELADEPLVRVRDEPLLVAQRRACGSSRSRPGRAARARGTRRARPCEPGERRRELGASAAPGLARLQRAP